MSEEMNFVISIRDLSISFEEQRIIQDVNFDIAHGEFVYLLGKTGSGKSSILKSIYADLPIAEGEILVSDFKTHEITDVQKPFLRRSLGIVFQDFELLHDRNVSDNLSFVLEATDWTDASAIKYRINEVLSMVYLQGKNNQFPHQLSGGEQRRLTIARALLNNPKVILADEPTANLDPTVANEILSLFVELSKKGTAVLLATHRHSFIKKHPARILFCENNQVRDIDIDSVVQKML